MLLTAHVKPNARKNTLAWLDEDTVKISVIAAPEDGKANKAVILLIAEELGVAPSLLSIVRGASNRLKHIKVPDQILPLKKDGNATTS